MRIPVSIDSSRPIFIEADADQFGQVFARMADDEQVHVLRAMVEAMKPHRGTTSRLRWRRTKTTTFATSCAKSSFRTRPNHDPARSRHPSLLRR